MDSRSLFLLLAAGCTLGFTPQLSCAQNSPPLQEVFSAPVLGDAVAEIDEDLQVLKSTPSTGETDRGKRAQAAAAYALGLHLEEQGRLDQALLRLREAARDDPRYVPILARVGLVLIKLKQPKEALAWTETALARHPGSGELMALQSVAHAELKNSAQAENWARRSLQANPRLLAAYSVLVQQAVIRGENGRVRELFEECKKIQSDQASFYARLATLWIQYLPSDGKTLPSQAAREVAPFLQKAASLDPENLLLTLSLGQAAFMGGEYAKAAEYFEKVAKRKPDAALLQQRLAECYLRLERPAEAIPKLEWLLERYPGKWALLPVLGELHGKLDQWPQAVECYKQAVLLTPPDPKVLFALAEAQMKAEDYDASLATLDKADGTFPLLSAFPYLRAIVLFMKEDYRASYDAFRRTESLALGGQDGLLNRDFYFRKAACAEKAGERAAMETALRHCIALNPDDHEALNFLGYSLAENGERLGEAEALIRRAVELQPTNAAYLDSLGWVYYQTGNYKSARAYLARAVEKMPDDPLVREHLGDAWWKLGYHERAIEHWTKALEKSEHPDVLRRKIKDLSPAAPR